MIAADAGTVHSMTLSHTEPSGAFSSLSDHSPEALPAAGAPADERDRADLLRAEALEQVMRLTCDESVLYPLLDPIPAHRTAVVVGRILGSLGIRPTTGCPLLALGADTVLDDGWRRHYPPAEKSLYSELLFCRELAGLAPGEENSVDLDAFAELEQLRDAVGFPDM